METKLPLTDAIRTTSRNLRFHAQEEYQCSEHLIELVVEVGNEGKEEVGCGKCKDAALHPPAFKCCNCNILFHLSRLQLGAKQGFRQEVDKYFQTLLSHCYHGAELIFDKDRQKYAEKERLYFACWGRVTDPTYKCSDSGCKLLFHKSCAHLPAERHHPLYPKHDLRLRLSEVKYNTETQRESYNSCKVCGKKCVNCLYYREDDGDIVLDVACALCEGKDRHDCQEHTFVSISAKFKFTCQACCKREEKGAASICSSSRLLIHGKCRSFSRFITITHHQHPLKLSFALRQLEGFENLSCDICRKKVIADYAAYQCQECDFVAHLPCTKKFGFRNETVDSYEKSIALITRAEEIKEMSLEEIHQHNLILNNEQLTKDILCDGCIQTISVPPFYSCEECNFFLHTNCAELLRKMWHPPHPHILSFLSKSPTQDCTFRCTACKNIRHGFSYKCDECEYSLDLHCCSIPKSVKHPIHRDPLLLALRPEKDCSGCGKKGNFACVDCGFSLCYRCVTIPVEASHPYDKHVLTLTHTGIAKDEFRDEYEDESRDKYEDESRDEYEDEYYCLILPKKKKI